MTVPDLSGVQVGLGPSPCSPTVPYQAALIASVGQQLANSSYIRITWRACETRILLSPTQKL